MVLLGSSPRRRSGRSILMEMAWAAAPSFDTRHRTEIAQMLGVTVHTADSHLRNAYAKLCVEDRGGLILRCIALSRRDVATEKGS